MGQNDGINTVVQSFNFDIQGVSSTLLNLKETRWDPVQIITSGRALPLVIICTGSHLVSLRLSSVELTP